MKIKNAILFLLSAAMIVTPSLDGGWRDRWVSFKQYFAVPPWLKNVKRPPLKTTGLVIGVGALAITGYLAWKYYNSVKKQESPIKMVDANSQVGDLVTLIDSGTNRSGGCCSSSASSGLVGFFGKISSISKEDETVSVLIVTSDNWGVQVTDGWTHFRKGNLKDDYRILFKRYQDAPTKENRDKLKVYVEALLDTIQSVEFNQNFIVDLRTLLDLLNKPETEK